MFGPGFTVNVGCVAFKELVAQFFNPAPTVQASATLFGWAAAYPDANAFLADARSMRFRWSDVGYNAALSAAAATLDAAARQANYARAEQILNHDVAAIAPLFNAPDGLSGSRA